MKQNKCKLIPIGIPKGGTGKSTLCELLSVEAAYQGHRVLVIDLDDETENTFNFVQRRNRFNENQKLNNQPTVPSIDCIQKNKEQEDISKDLVTKYSKDYDYIFVDNHPNAKKTFLYLCQMGDVVLFPIEYTIKAIEVLPKMASMMDNVNDDIKRNFPGFEGISVLAVINKASSVRRQAINDVKEIIKSFNNDFILSRTVIPQYTAYQNTGNGLTVSDTGEKGRAQVQLLLKEIEAIIADKER
jgi:cellulose biosynthesis protein BcsQ